MSLAHNLRPSASSPGGLPNSDVASFCSSLPSKNLTKLAQFRYLYVFQTFVASGAPQFRKKHIPANNWVFQPCFPALCCCVSKAEASLWTCCLGCMQTACHPKHLDASGWAQTNDSSKSHHVSWQVNARAARSPFFFGHCEGIKTTRWHVSFHYIPHKILPKRKGLSFIRGLSNHQIKSSTKNEASLVIR